MSLPRPFLLPAALLPLLLALLLLLALRTTQPTASRPSSASWTASDSCGAGGDEDTMSTKRARSAGAAAGAATKPRVGVLMSGLPGAMGHEVSRALVRREGVRVLTEAAMTGPNMPATVEVEGVGTVTLVDPSAEGAKDKIKAAVEKARGEFDVVLAVDFTHPTAVNANADLFNELKLPFVMGTTGGDRERLMESTQKAKNPAVIAPNMCKQVVAFQAMMDSMATRFPGSFNGYTLSVTESHQKTKADTSGTAKAVVKSLSAMVGGPAFEESQIKKVRGDDESKAFGVPEQFLTGHAWHTYRLESGDKTVAFEFQHNINGRATYAEGVADAVEFLAAKIVAKAKPKIYSMIDVLEAGGMR